MKGLLLIDKPKGKTSFSLVAALRRRLGVKTIGHAGTLDPFATGVMVLLVGREYTRKSSLFLEQDKEYLAHIYLGITTDSYDSTGKVMEKKETIPSFEAVQQSLEFFQGEIEQIPPMFSAKKVGGKKLYELARKGKTVERKAVIVSLKLQLLEYNYPNLVIKVACSKGTYIRSLAHDIGQKLGTGAHLFELRRLKSGPFHVEDCIDGHLLETDEPISQYLKL